MTVTNCRHVTPAVRLDATVFHQARARQPLEPAFTIPVYPHKLGAGLSGLQWQIGRAQTIPK